MLNFTGQMHHAHFTPSLMDRHTLEATFVQRHRLLERHVDLIENAVLTGSTQHTLLVGPRGLGKTHFVSLLFYRILGHPELEDRLRIAWLREEEWGVSSFMDLLLRILRSLADEYSDSELDSKMQALFDLAKEEAEIEAERLLRSWLAERSILLIVENLDDLFAGLGPKGQNRFRAMLQEDLPMSIFATTPALFQGISRRAGPFFGFFRIHHLERLTLEQAVELVGRSLERRGEGAQAKAIRSGRGRARIRVIHHLAGGNHRVFSIFSQFLTSGTLDSLVSPVLRTIDDLTPYYQSKIAQLAPLQRKIVEVLCERRGAIPVQQIARRCFVTPQTASGQLTQLRKLQLVDSESFGRNAYYELSEPLMRLSVEIKKSRGEPIRLLVDFLRLWFTRSELEDRLDRVREQERSTEEAYLTTALEHSDLDTESNDPKVQSLRIEFDEFDDEENLERATSIAHELVALDGSSEDWRRLGLSLEQDGQIGKAAKAYATAIEKDPRSPNAWNSQGVVLGYQDKHEEALECFSRAMDLDAEEPIYPNNMGWTFFWLGDYDKAKTQLEKAVRVSPTDIRFQWDLAQFFSDSKRWEEAIAIYDRIIESRPQDRDAYRVRSYAYFRSGKSFLAIPDLVASLEADLEQPIVWAELAAALAEEGSYSLALLCNREFLLSDSVAAQAAAVVTFHRSGKRADASYLLEALLEGGNQDPWLLNNAGVAAFSRGRMTAALVHFDRIAEVDDSPELHVGLNRASALIGLDRLPEAGEALRAALEQLGDDPEQTADDCAIVRNLLMSVEEESRWPGYIDLWIECFAEAGAMPILGHGLVHSIPPATSSWLHLERATAWSRIWQEKARGHPSLELPLRLLVAAIEFRSTDDPRVLAGLAKEERSIVKPLLRCAESRIENLIPRIEALLDAVESEAEDPKDD